jgi:hypothetical protein
VCSDIKLPIFLLSTGKLAMWDTLEDPVVRDKFGAQYASAEMLEVYNRPDAAEEQQAAAAASSSSSSSSSSGKKERKKYPRARKNESDDDD